MAGHMKAHIEGVGLLAPGLAGWRAARPVLAGDARYEYAAMLRPAAEILPPAERRRCGDVVKLALHVGAEALAESGARAPDVATVFTCSSGNGEVLHQICETLAGAARDVSPTRFHNSVHNAPAGYWSIATGSRTASTSLCAHDGSFAAGLLEGVVQAMSAARPVLLVAYDIPPPPPLAAVVPVAAPCGLALLLAPARGAATLATLELALAEAGDETTLGDAALERLRQANPAARGLTILAALAAASASPVTLDYLPGRRLVASVHATASGG
jgi:hypothetical protein